MNNKKCKKMIVMLGDYLLYLIFVGFAFIVYLNYLFFKSDDE